MAHCGKQRGEGEGEGETWVVIFCMMVIRNDPICKQIAEDSPSSSLLLCKPSSFLQVLLSIPGLTLPPTGHPIGPLPHSPTGPSPLTCRAILAHLSRSRSLGPGAVWQKTLRTFPTSIVSSLTSPLGFIWWADRSAKGHGGRWASLQGDSNHGSNNAFHPPAWQCQAIAC